MNWLKKLLSPKPKSPPIVITDDELQAYVIQRAFQSGNMVFGNVEADGTITIKEVHLEKENI